MGHSGLIGNSLPLDSGRASAGGGAGIEGAPLGIVTRKCSPDQKQPPEGESFDAETGFRLAPEVENRGKVTFWSTAKLAQKCAHLSQIEITDWLTNRASGE